MLLLFHFCYLHSCCKLCILIHFAGRYQLDFILIEFNAVYLWWYCTSHIFTMNQLIECLKDHLSNIPYIVSFASSQPLMTFCWWHSLLKVDTNVWQTGIKFCNTGIVRHVTGDQVWLKQIDLTVRMQTDWLTVVWYCVNVAVVECYRWDDQKSEQRMSRTRVIVFIKVQSADRHIACCSEPRMPGTEVEFTLINYSLSYSITCVGHLWYH